MNHRAPWWLPGGHAQTIWPALQSRTGRLPVRLYQRERWPTPDDDFVDVDWLDARPRKTTAPLLVLFHGLEGSSHSHYALALAQWAQAQGWGFVVPHFRGCSGEINRAPRSYHSGDFDNVLTAPLHGFQNTRDYWLRASAKPRLADIRVPTLVVNALNDPFVPAHSLPGQNDVGSMVTLWQPKHCGHVGFSAGLPPGRTCKHCRRP